MVTASATLVKAKCMHAWIFNLRPHERGLNLSKFPNLIQESE